MRYVSKLKGLDYFGHKTSLKFGSWQDRKSSSDSIHKTIFGGFISLLLRVVFIFAIYYFFQKMISYQGTNTSEQDIDIKWQ
jgi:hypothetical protein